MNSSYSFIWMSIFTIITSVFPFVTRAIMIKYMGIEYAGLNSIFNSVLNILNLTELGIGEALVFYLYKPMAEKDVVLVNSYLNLYKKVYLIIGIIVTVFSLLITPFLPFVIKYDCPKDINIFVLYFVYVINTLVSYFCFSYVFSIFQTNQALYLDYRMRSIVWIIIYILQIFAICKYKDYYLYSIYIIVGTIIINILDYCIAKKYFPEYKAEGNVDKSFYKELVSKVFAIALNKVKSVVINSVDSIIISSYLGLAFVAEYNNYYSIMIIPNMLRGIISKSVLQSMGNSIALESKESNYAVLTLYSFLVQLIAAIGSIVLLCVLKPFIIWWVGEEYVLAKSTEILFVVYFYVIQLSVIAEVVRNSTGMWEKGKWFAIVETATNLILDIVLVKLMGINGIIIATVISILAFSIPIDIYVVYKLYFNKRMGLVYRDYAKNILLTILCAGVTLAVTTNIVFSTILYELILKGIVALIISSACIFLSHINDFRMWDIIKLFIGVSKNIIKKE